MKKLNLLGLFILVQLFSPKSFGLVCPDNSTIKACPTSGSTLLDETYPTQAFVISNQPYNPSNESSKVTQKFVSKIIESYDYQNVPQVILQVQERSEFNEIVNQIRQDLTKKKISPEKINIILAQVTWGNMPNYLWQQDWFESFINPKTGQPVIRQLDSYERVNLDASLTFAENSGQCGITSGESLKENFGDPESMRDIRSQGLSFGSGEMGGNIEGAPGGLCLVGDNLGKTLSSDFCGSQKNVITLQTSWMSVGHVDEIFKIIPTQYNDGRPKECEFSLMSASPKKALELMSHPQRGQTSFVNLNLNSAETDVVQKRISRTNEQFQVNHEICLYIHNAVINNPKNFNSLPSATRSVFLKLFFGNEAHAQSATPSFKTRKNLDIKEITQNCRNNIDQVTNFQMQQLMKINPDFMTLNNAIEESIAKDKALIKSRILSRLPQCQKYYDELDVPNIFFNGKTYKTSDGKIHLQRPSSASSFLPNPTNSVLMNKTLLVPNSENDLYNDYLKDELKKRKIKTDFIPTWDYAHLGYGNLHCASHSINHCKPNK